MDMTTDEVNIRELLEDIKVLIEAKKIKKPSTCEISAQMNASDQPGSRLKAK